MSSPLSRQNPADDCIFASLCLYVRQENLHGNAPDRLQIVLPATAEAWCLEIVGLVYMPDICAPFWKMLMHAALLPQL